MPRNKLILIICDGILLNCSFLVALLLRFENSIPIDYYSLYSHTFWLLTVISLSCFMLTGLYHSLWSYAGAKELIHTFLCIMISSMIFYFCLNSLPLNFPHSVYFIYFILASITTSGLRLTYRIARRLRNLIIKSKELSCYKNHRILLIGAGDAASLIIKELQYLSPFHSPIILAVDDSPHKQNASIHGIPIKGTIKDIPSLVAQHHINHIILAIPSASKQRTSEILTLCNTTSCKLEIFPGIQNSLNDSPTLKHLRAVSIEDLLGREEISLDNTPLTTYLQNKVILVTGGGGSIGSELCRQIIKYNPHQLLIFDIYENNAYELQQELLANGTNPEQLKVIIGSVRDEEKLRRVFEQFRPNLVFHAAAHKHVPLMETNPCEVIKNNVFGTLHTALYAKQYEAEKFILISTDKAVNPTNIMGASKRLCEMIIQSLASTHCKTSFAAVRFGNVLGSNGSVIPLFRKQLEAGGPLTVTHEEIIRYFMTIPEAVRLILQATTFAKGGEIFVLDMGQPVKIMDLAKNFIKLSGLELGKDIQIEVTGLRPGEKLYEELLMSEEGLQKTSCDKIFVGQPLDINFESLLHSLYALENVLYDETSLKQAIMNLVPTYHPNSFSDSLLTDTSDPSTFGQPVNL